MFYPRGCAPGAAVGNHAHCYIGKVCCLLLVRADYIREALSMSPVRLYSHSRCSGRGGGRRAGSFASPGRSEPRPLASPGRSEPRPLASPTVTAGLHSPPRRVHRGQARRPIRSETASHQGTGSDSPGHWPSFSCLSRVTVAPDRATARVDRPVFT